MQNILIIVRDILYLIISNYTHMSLHMARHEVNLNYHWVYTYIYIVFDPDHN